MLRPTRRQNEHGVDDRVESLLIAGAWADKYAFKDSQASRIFVWYDDGTRSLIWGTSKSDMRSHRVELLEVVGVLFGPCTTTFHRAARAANTYSPWCCISLLFVGRTLDLCFVEDVADQWFLTLQRTIHAVNQVPREQLLRQKIWMKIEYKAMRLHRSLGFHFKKTAVDCYKALHSGQSRGSNRTNQNVKNLINDVRSELLGVRRQVSNLVIQQFENMRSDVLSQVSVLAPSQDTIARYTLEIERLKNEHRKIRDELISLKGNIRVFARLRPLLGCEVSSSSPLDDSPLIIPFPDRMSVYSVREMRRKNFMFDSVFQPSQKQDKIFQEVAPLVDSCVDGYNVCIFAYGATNSGKSYTMEGTSDNPGLSVLSCRRIFDQVQFPSNRYKVSMSVVQIYNEAVMDLLNDMKELPIRMAENSESFHLVNVTKMDVNSVDLALEVLTKASTMRTTKATDLNGFSSRSHCLVTMYVENLVAGTCGKLNLVDLAGSENVSRSGATGDTLRETQYINKSLSALGDVIHALIEKSSKRTGNMHIPFRNSKLTMLLRDSLSGNSKTLMIVQISPSDTDISETNNSLAFGTRVRNVEVGRPYRNQ